MISAVSVIWLSVVVTSSNYYDDNYAYILKSIVCNINSYYRTWGDGYVKRKKKWIQDRREKVKRISIITQKLFNYLFIATYKWTWISTTDVQVRKICPYLIDVIYKWSNVNFTS